MRVFGYICLCISTILLMGCGGSSGGDVTSADSSVFVQSSSSRPANENNDDQREENDDLPQLSQSFATPNDYSFADFQLTADVRYWEMRLGPRDGLIYDEEMEEWVFIPRHHPAETLWSFDSEQYQLLSEEIRQQVAESSSETGFTAGCQPDYCPVFAVAVKNDDVKMAITLSELLGLFDYLDTEAELYLWLWANEYQPLSYKKDVNSYEVIVHWLDPMCREDKYYRLFVDQSGGITEMELLLKKAPDLCS